MSASINVLATVFDEEGLTPNLRKQGYTRVHVQQLEAETKRRWETAGRIAQRQKDKLVMDAIEAKRKGKK